jgi:hypothetical protein
MAMKSFHIKAIVVVALVVTGLVLAIGGCGGGGAAATSTTASSAVLPSTATTTTTVLAALPLDELSTFESKDPFIQQAVPTTAASSTTTGTGPTTTSHSTTTTQHTTTTHSGSTSSTIPTSVTSPSHSLKVLSIDVINGTPVVTIQVDGTVYADKKVGASFSTGWGGIKILAIDPQAQTVTLLHGSETLTLRVGQSILK